VGNAGRYPLRGTRPHEPPPAGRVLRSNNAPKNGTVGRDLVRPTKEFSGDAIMVDQPIEVILPEAAALVALDAQHVELADKIVLINTAGGVGENVVQGAVDPDEYEVFKPFRPTRRDIHYREGARRKGPKDDLRDGSECPTRNAPNLRSRATRFVLYDESVLQLARWACVIEGALRLSD
jgi:phosphoenolpyruvate synthase/pyruvate phosphate dikinase